MTHSMEELKKWDDKIVKLVDKFNLNCYPQEYEICDHNDMLGYMAYSGMPSRYSHWSFGKSFEKQQTMYNYGVSGLPYEMVINSDPCLAYLMRDNTLLLQILTMAHVYGHNDFFANNFTFTSGTDAKYTLEMFKNHGKRIDSYIEDPSIGIDLVEDILDSAHTLSMQRSSNLAITKLSHAQKARREWDNAKPKDDPYADIHPKKEFIAPDLHKIPFHPEANILEFIAEHNTYMPSWQRDVLTIVDKEMQYFMPQMETKIMNEGWASYWHYTILNELNLAPDLHMEFLVRHNQVLRPHPGSLNPYHLGFIMWHDIEKRFNEKENATSSSPFEMTPGREKMFEIRRSDRDQAFLRRFLTVDIMRELDLFEHDQRGNERVVSNISDEENWSKVKNTLISSIGTGSIPKIFIEDADFGRNRTLYLKHQYDGRELELNYAENTLKHLRKLWGREVVLETFLGKKKSLLKFKEDKLEIENLKK